MTRSTNNKFFILTICLTLWAAPANFAAAADATNTNTATGRLLLCDGDSLPGNLVSIDTNNILLWRYPDAAEPVAFKLNRVSQMDLRPPDPPPRGTNCPCRVILTQGDVLDGSLVSCTPETLSLQTWCAGQLSLPRQSIQSVIFFPSTTDSFLFADPEDWTQGAAEGALGVQAGQWTWRDGAYYAATSASIARDLKLPDAAEMQFDLAWRGQLYLSLALYADALQPLLIADKDKIANFGAFYSMRFQSSYVDVARIKKNENPIIYLPPVVVPAFSQTNRAHIDVRARKKSNTLALSVNGQLLQVWNDTNGFVGEGTVVRFVHNGNDLIKISNLRLSPWDGVLQSDQTNLPPEDQDTLWLTNNTFQSGVLESLADGKATLQGKLGKTEIPLEQIIRIVFAPQKGGAPAEAEGTVHATLARGGPLTFQLTSWTPEGVTLRSPVFGQARFDPNAFRRLVLRPLDSAAAPTNNPESPVIVPDRPRNLP